MSNGFSRGFQLYNATTKGLTPEEAEVCKNLCMNLHGLLGWEQQGQMTTVRDGLLMRAWRGIRPLFLNTAVTDTVKTKDIVREVYLKKVLDILSQAHLEKDYETRKKQKKIYNKAFSRALDYLSEDGREKFFQYLIDHQQTEKFLEICNQPHSVVDPKIKSAFKRFSETYQAPITEIEEPETSTTVNEVLKEPEPVKAEEETSEPLHETIEEIPYEDPVISEQTPQPVIEAVVIEDQVRVIAVDGTLIEQDVTDPMGASLEEEMKGNGSTGKKSQKRIKTLKNELIARGYGPLNLYAERADVERINEVCADDEENIDEVEEKTKRCPHAIIEVYKTFGDKVRQAQIAVWDRYARSTYVIKKPLNIDPHGNELKTSDLKNSDTVWMVPRRDQDQWLRDIIKLIDTDIEDLEPQHKHRVDWRLVTRADVIDTLTAYIVNTGGVPETTSKKMIGYGSLAGYATISKLYGALSRGSIEGFNKGTTFKEVYNLASQVVPLKGFLHAKPINIKDVFSDTVKSIKQEGIVPQKIRAKDIELAGRKGDEIELALKYNALVGWDDPNIPREARSAANLDELMIAFGIGEKSSSGKLVPVQSALTVNL